jgi:SAM-dependent methyltransferase
MLSASDYKKRSAYQSWDLSRPWDFKSQDKKKLLRLDLLDLKYKKVLDVGCCYGYFLEAVYREGANRLIGIDINPENLEASSVILENDCNDAIVTICNRDFRCDEPPEQDIDVIMTLSVTHYLGESRSVAEKMHRILNMGGIWIWEGIHPLAMDQSAKRAGFEIIFRGPSNREHREVRHYRKDRP